LLNVSFLIHPSYFFLSLLFPFLTELISAIFRALILNAARGAAETFKVTKCRSWISEFDPMPRKSESLIPIEQIDGMIRTIRGSRVILDSDLAKIYGVPTFRFNEAIKRNRHRFPPDFMFQLTTEEAAALRSQIAILKETAEEGLTPNSSQIAILKKGRGQHRKYRPYAFTEHGALQAANVLRSPRAVQMNTTCGDAVG
jgi:hypothetical protein